MKIEPDRPSIEQLDFIVCAEDFQSAEGCSGRINDAHRAHRSVRIVQQIRRHDESENVLRKRDRARERRSRADHWIGMENEARDAFASGNHARSERRPVDSFSHDVDVEVCAETRVQRFLEHPDLIVVLETPFGQIAAAARDDHPAIELGHSSSSRLDRTGPDRIGHS